VVDTIWGGGKEEAHRKNELYSEVWCGEVVRGVRGWRSTARGVGRLYIVARCSGRGRIGRREAGAGCSRRLSGDGNGSTVGGERQRRKKGCLLHGGGWAPFIAVRGGGRRWHGGGETVGGEIVAAKLWAWARWWRVLFEGGQRGLGAISLRD
jgi:hypothetical protein